MTRVLYRPDAEQRRLVEALAACGIEEGDIARVVGIGVDLLHQHHRDELETGAILANAKVAENLLQKALGDSPQSVTAAMFWLKARAGWSEGANKSASTEPAGCDAQVENAAREFDAKVERLADRLAAKA